MANTWIITTDGNVSALVEAGRKVGGSVTAVVIGDAAVPGVDRLLRVELPADAPAESMAPTVAAAIGATDGDVVLAANKPAERVLAGAVAASLDAPLLLGLRSIEAGSASLSRFGGILDEEVSFTSPVVAVMDGGSASEGDEPDTEGVTGNSYTATITSSKESEGEQVNLGSAKRIVAVGRGFKAEDDLQLANAFAKAIGAEVACSRPVAEGSGWLPRDRYVGVSGQHLSPDLYIAVGISGQIQHTAGMKDAKTVVVINQDENAPFFNDADYGIVGDLYTVLPELTKAASE